MIQNLQTHTWFVIVGFGCKLIHFKFSIVGFGRARSHSWFTTVEMGNTILHSRLFFMWDLEVHHLASGLLSWFSEAHGLNRCSLFWDFVFFDILILSFSIVIFVWYHFVCVNGYFAQFHMLSIFSYILFMQCGFYLI